MQMNYNSVLSRLCSYYVFIDSTPMQIKIHIEGLREFIFQLYTTFLSPWMETNRTVPQTHQVSLETINSTYKVIKMRTKSIGLSFWALFRLGLISLYSTVLHTGSFLVKYLPWLQWNFWFAFQAARVLVLTIAPLHASGGTTPL